MLPTYGAVLVLVLTLCAATGYVAMHGALLQAVSDPVAVSPDTRLRAHALAQGWPVIDPSPHCG